MPSSPQTNVYWPEFISEFFKIGKRFLCMCIMHKQMDLTNDAYVKPDVL